MKTDAETGQIACASVLDQRALRLRAHHDLRCWMRKYPRLFGTKVQVDCFITIGLLTTGSALIPSLSTLYRRLAYAENSVRSYIRSLADGGWVSFVRSPSGDKRSIGLRLEKPIVRVYDEYFGLLEAIALEPPPAAEPAAAAREDALDPNTLVRISA